jgi:SAM-dependent methyltransferase
MYNRIQIVSMEKMKRYIKELYLILKAMTKHPQVFTKAMQTVPSICSAYEYARTFQDAIREAADSNTSSLNPLWEFFQNYKEGPGIWKWEHYFNIYHRHLAKFIGQKVDVLEIGIYSGGSLEMWRSYFGENCHIYGVDIEKACKAYENDHISVFIGDQEDRAFWADFRNSVQGRDILIDDGGHAPESQQITLEEMLRHLRPGGVYLCEDVHGSFNLFSAFANGPC